ncbi:MAG: hypothetical protein CVV45_10990 [Spirochaetae bacterium HGW-Spirochaetae-10]|nr:MAG: hypothetical protein CVV45_10990 [Spirochaetae bacterium HGW-Spirochaetae-10]
MSIRQIKKIVIKWESIRLLFILPILWYSHHLSTHQIQSPWLPDYIARVALINLAFLAGPSSEAAVVLVTGKPFSWKTRASLFLSGTLFSLMSIRAAFGDD